MKLLSPHLNPGRFASLEELHAHITLECVSRGAYRPRVAL